jgi:hypothetical protein
LWRRFFLRRDPFVLNLKATTRTKHTRELFLSHQSWLESESVVIGTTAKD